MELPALLRVGDVYLDSPRWSGGNTTLEAMAVGLPIVTLPGPLMRGRHTAGILRAAEEAIVRADRAERATALREKLRESKQLIPLTLLILLVFFSLMFGWATATSPPPPGRADNGARTAQPRASTPPA